ncbi:YveK family protein [Salimicrobium flavidum]|uniref:Capsular polysaccharide biosynthesis protein n=1 Tax=Salimicrobium flavidum TaxID=570947 RepID=A0A1N7KN22_9BACI|nr:Wzz/FepE/Etk N-terminal domain-containing protein [Salimicrobium flavidum]SIS62957.1 Capsular polysaccharide biosynthesis protein [Salimicrobium flavidum]
MNEKMDVSGFLKVMKRRYVSILSVTMGVFLLSVVVSMFVMKPTYEVNENLVIGNLNKTEEYSETQQLNMLLASTIDFIKSPSVLNEVSRESGLSSEQINEMIIIRNTEDSQIINVIVRDENPETAEVVSGLIAKTTVDKMTSVFGVQDIVALDDPTENSQVQQVGGVLLNLSIGLVVGLLAGIGVAMFREHTDDSLQTSKEIEALLGVPLLGEIDMKEKVRGRSSRPYTGVQPENDVEAMKRKKRGEVSV